jgi:hypothetical protein
MFQRLRLRSSFLTIESKENARNPNVSSLINECAEFDADIFAASSLTATNLIVGSAHTN